MDFRARYGIDWAWSEVEEIIELLSEDPQRAAARIRLLKPKIRVTKPQFEVVLLDDSVTVDRQLVWVGMRICGELEQKKYALGTSLEYRPRVAVLETNDDHKGWKTYGSKTDKRNALLFARCFEYC